MATTSTLSRRASEFAGVALFAVVAHLADCARHARADRSRVVLHRGRHAPARRTSSGSSGAFLSEAVAPGARLRVVPGARRAGGRRVEPFWCRAMDSAYTKVVRRRHVPRLPERALRADRRQRRSERPDVPGRRLRRRVDWRRMHRVPEPPRRDHRRAHAAGALGHHGRRSSRSGATFAALFKAFVGDGLPAHRAVPQLARGTPARSRAARGHRQAHEEERWNGRGRGGGVGGRGSLTHAREGTGREEPRAAARGRDRGRRRRRGLPRRCRSGVRR